MKYRRIRSQDKVPVRHSTECERAFDLYCPRCKELADRARAGAESAREYLAKGQWWAKVKR